MTTHFEFRYSDQKPSPKWWGWLGLLLLFALVLLGYEVRAQSGDPKWFFRGTGPGDQTGYVTKANNTLYAINGSGNFALLAQSNFANASHTHPASAITDFNAVGDARWSLLAHTHAFADLTSKPTTVAGYGITDFNSLGDARWSLLAHTHVSADITDGSTGGNGVTDAGKVVKFGSHGQLQSLVDGDFVTSGISAALANGNGGNSAISGYAENGVGGSFVSENTVGPALECSSMDGTYAADLFHAHNTDGDGIEVRNDGGIEWTSPTGAQTTATNLPAFGTATKGVVPASGGGTTNFLRADGTWTAAGGGSGTVTSVAVSGSDGIEVDSGSPVTTSGTIALGVNAATLKTHLSLGNVENTALSTWAGSTAITTLGTITTGSVPAANVSGLGTLALLNDGDVLSSGLTFPSSGLRISAAFRTLAFKSAEVFTVGRSLEFVLNDGDRVLTLPGDATISGTNTGDQTITNSSDATSHTVTLSASGGSVQLIEGSGVTLTTGGTSGAGTVTIAASGGGGSGTVTSVSVATANGVSGSVADATTTPAITLSLGAITPTSVNGVTLSGSSSPTLAVTGTTAVSGTNTGDQTNISGNAATVTTNANLTGPITSVGNATTVAETELAAIAATTSAADKGIQYTGSGTATDYNLKFGTEAAYTGTPTFTAGAAPSGASTKTQFWERNGNRVTWQIMLTYATAGTTVTNLSLTFPTEFPTPAIPTGFTGADVRLWNCDATRLISTPSGTIANAGVFMISRNAADNGFVIASTGTFTSGSYRTFILSGNYFTDTQ